MSYQFRVDRLFQHLSMLHLACHANAITAWLIGTMLICFISRCISFTNNVVFKSNAVGWHSKFTPLAIRYMAHIKDYFRTTGHKMIEICRDTMPDRDLCLYANHEECNYMCDGIKQPLIKNYEIYVQLRQQGVTQERLLLAMTAEAEFFMNHGFFEKY
jgi:hypothetical protein